MGTPFRIFILLGVFFLLAGVDGFCMYPFPIFLWMFCVPDASVLILSAAVSWALLAFYLPVELTAWLLKGHAVKRLWKLTMMVFGLVAYCLFGVPFYVVVHTT